LSNLSNLPKIAEDAGLYKMKSRKAQTRERTIPLKLSEHETWDSSNYEENRPGPSKEDLVLRMTSHQASKRREKRGQSPFFAFSVLGKKGSKFPNF
jgi:hypothetical protein